MAGEVWSVETVLVLNDRLIAGLKAVSRELRTIDTLAEKVKANLGGPGFLGMQVAEAEKLRTAMGGVLRTTRLLKTEMRGMEVNPEAVRGVQSISRNLGRARDRAVELRAALSGITVPPIPPRGGGRGAGGHGRGGGLYGRFHEGPIGAHFGVGALELGGIGIGIGALTGLRQSAEVQRSILAAVMATGVDPTSAAGRAEYADLQNVTEQLSRRSIFAPATVAKALPSILGITDVPYAQSRAILPTAVRYAEASNIVGAAQGRAPGIEESAQAAIRMAHVMGILDPAKMEPILHMALVAQQTTGRTPAQLEKQLMYVAGSSRLMGMSPEQTMQLAAISALALPGTTAGTALNQFLLSTLPQGGPGSGTRIHRGSAARAKELREMGIVDAQGHALTDPMAIIAGLGHYRQTHSPTEVASHFRQLFNVRGMRAAEWLSFEGVLDKMIELARRMKSAPDPIAFQRILMGEGVIPQLQGAWANVEGILALMTQGTLPALSAGLRTVNEGMDRFRGFLSGHHGIATAMGVGAEGLGALVALRLARRLLLGGGGAGLIGRGAGAAAGAAAAAGVSMPQIAAGAAITGIGAYGAYRDYQKAGGGWWGLLAALPAALGIAGPASFGHGVVSLGKDLFGASGTPAAGGGIAESIAGALHGMSVQLQGATTLTGTVVLNAEGFGRAIADMVAKGISHAESSAATAGARPDLSTFPAIPF